MEGDDSTVRGISFVTFPGFLGQYCSKEVTSVRLNTINASGSSIIVNGSMDYVQLVNRIKTCIPELDIHYSFNLTLWVYDGSLVVSISKMFSTSCDSSEPVTAVDIASQILQLSNNMPVVAFEVYFTYAKPGNHTVLFVVV